MVFHLRVRYASQVLSMNTTPTPVPRQLPFFLHHSKQSTIIRTWYISTATYWQVRVHATAVAAARLPQEWCRMMEVNKLFNRKRPTVRYVFFLKRKLLHYSNYNMRPPTESLPLELGNKTVSLHCLTPGTWYISSTRGRKLDI